MIQVVIDSAFSGSTFAPRDSKPNGKSIKPARYLVWTNGSEIAGTTAVIVAKIVKPTTSHVMGAQLVAEFGKGVPFSLESNACRNATTVTRFVTVSSDSAEPCSQSLSANDTPYRTWAAMAAGIVKKTNNKHVVKPTVTPFGHWFSSLASSHRKAR